MRKKYFGSQRNVHFLDKNCISTTGVAPLYRIETIDKWNNVLWYSPMEMKVIKNRTRVLCHYLAHQKKVTASNLGHKVLTNDQPTLSNCPQTRGLEYYICNERRRRKYFTKKFILQAAEDIRHLPYANEKLAELAKECNKWATKLAIEEGRRDYINAYHTNDEDLQSIHLKNKEI
jgi:hypothetical protein